MTARALAACGILGILAAAGLLTEGVRVLNLFPRFAGVLAYLALLGPLLCVARGRSLRDPAALQDSVYLAGLLALAQAWVFFIVSFHSVVSVGARFGTLIMVPVYALVLAEIAIPLLWGSRAFSDAPAPGFRTWFLTGGGLTTVAGAGFLVVALLLSPAQTSFPSPGARAGGETRVVSLGVVEGTARFSGGVARVDKELTPAVRRLGPGMATVRIRASAAEWETHRPPQELAFARARFVSGRLLRLGFPPEAIVVEASAGRPSVVVELSAREAR